jgi:hypothetical protein
VTINFSKNILHHAVWSRVLLEKLTVTKLAKKFPGFYGTRRFTPVFTRAPIPKTCVTFRNKLAFYGELLAPRPTKLQDPRGLREKVTAAQPVNKFPAFYKIEGSFSY